MWEYWGSKKNSISVPEDLQRLAPEQGLSAVDEVTVVPNLHTDTQQDGQPPEPDGSRAHVYFKDLSISILPDDESEEDEPIPGLESGVNSDQLSSPDSKSSMTPRLIPKLKTKLKHVHRQKLVIILVGLPARGKTFLCNKLMCYFNWLGHPTKHINVGMYRRKIQGSDVEAQDSSFFDPNNAAGNVARHKALCAALEDMEQWLAGDEAQVAILDATNSTSSRRNYLRERLHGRFEYMFLESICEDQKVLEENYRLKMKYSPDYRGAHMEDALRDFKERIKNYESAYETITDRTLHYVKLINMVTGRGYMDVNRISGYIPGKMVFYLMQICKALGRSRKIWLTRHGQSLYNVKGKIGGNSDLSIRGAAYTHLLPAVLASRVPSVGGKPVPVAVWTSTLNRTIATAANLPYPKVRWKALDEIQSGVCDGMTYADIKERMPEEHELRKKDKLRYRYPSGESYMDVIQRLEPVVIEVERDRECICIVAHQAVLRALYGYFMNRSLEEVPHIDIPLHTLIELTPKADGTMAETRFRVDVDKALQEMEWVASCEDIGPNRQFVSDTESDISSDQADSSAMPSSFKDGGFRRSLSLAELAEAHLVTTQQINVQRENDRM